MKSNDWLVDTSVWIDFIRGNETSSVTTLKKLLQQNKRIYLTPIVYLEILQGSADFTQFSRFKNYFGSQLFVDLKDPIASMAEAASIYFRCRKAGITVRSSLDSVLVQVALENELTLLHNDRDFEQISKVVPELRQMRFYEYD